MTTPRLLVPLSFGAILACGSVPNDPGARIFPPAGVIRGTVVYQGPHPCSRNGHIVGNALVLVFDRRNPPPPNGLANTVVNFGDVTGDRLFTNEPRYQGNDTTYCPAQHGATDVITASGQFEIAPVAGGSYELQAFFDYTGDWLPEFKIRNLPEEGDIAGGNVDTADALKPINVGNPNYQPHFLPVDVGVPQALGASANGLPNPIPNYVIPSNGYITDNVTVTIGLPLTTTRPYFYPQGGTFDPSKTPPFQVTQSADQLPATLPANALEGAPPPSSPSTQYYYMPVLTIPQDIQVLAPPTAALPSPASVNLFESKFPHLQLQWGVSAALGETGTAVNPSEPFHMQIAPFVAGSPPSGGGFAVWENAVLDPSTQQYVPQQIAEGNNVPLLWPLVVLSKLVDDYAPDANGKYPHAQDPASLTAQGDPKNPVVILQGITLLGNADPQKDNLYDSAFHYLLKQYFNSGTHLPIVSLQNHLTVMIRPSVICFNTLFDPNNPDKRGTLVTPYLRGNSADSPPKTDQPIVPTDLLNNPDETRQSIKGLVKGDPVPGCLPKGRYAINLVYPDGQAWTVPNEAGACSGSEGATSYPPISQNGPLPTATQLANVQCVMKQRPVLLSQGNRAVVEIVGPQDPTNCTAGGKVPAVPAQCLPQP
jgi:hypothetical protein